MLPRVNHPISRKFKFMEFLKSNDVYYGTKLATTAEPLILWHHICDVKNCKLRVLSNKCYLDFTGQSIDDVSKFLSLRPSEWRVRRPARRNFRLHVMYSFELPFNVKSKLRIHLMEAQPARELQSDFTSILPSTKLETLAWCYRKCCALILL